MSDTGRFWAAARMPLLIAVVAAIAAGLVATALLMPPRRTAADLPGITTADGKAGAGLIVTSVRSGSSADQAGIRVGDTIVSLEGRRVTSRVAALHDEDVRIEKGAAIDMQVAHNHAIRHVTLKQGED